MFTGIIEAVACILTISRTADAMTIQVEMPFSHVGLGDSIAVDGVCLTVTRIEGPSCFFDVSAETLHKTYFNDLEIGQLVNLEQATRANSKMGGHYVTGHVDCTLRLHYFEQIDNYVKMRVGGFDDNQARFLIPKGSITVNGVSLTINDVTNDSFELMLVPHTLQHTTLQHLFEGQWVNIEFDYMARLVAHQLEYYLEHTLKKIKG
jgi:riboflavin synthase